ncbi:MAG: response regulator [Ktedonobacteraceae bacterium]|nr:response regulator [Ktedonobacteraceae bacterium]
MGQKILVVDDDEDIVEVMQIVLQTEGYEVITSPDGDYLTHYSQGLPDLILLDVLLKGQNGSEICRRLKSDARTASIPVIMLSAHTETEKLADISGADDFLEKPFDVDELLGKVASYFVSTSCAGEAHLLDTEPLNN